MSKCTINVIQNRKHLLFFLPAIVAFFIALIPTLKFQLPLSWDVFFHIHMARLYLEHGIIIWDPLTYAPFGRPIYYPPGFHFFIAILSKLTAIDLLKITRLIQPFLAFSVVLSFTYLVCKLYNLSVGFLAGLLLIITLPFYRFMLPIPESMVMIFLPLAIYFYYQGLEKNIYPHILVSGVLSGLNLLIHPSSGVLVILVLGFYTFILKLVGRNIFLKYFLLYATLAIFIASWWWVPLLLNYGYAFHVTTIIVPLSDYPRIFGITLIFAPLGGYLLLKNKGNKDLLILTWLIILLISSQIYLMGIPILSDRVLYYAVLPTTIMAAYGLSYMLGYFERNPHKKQFYYILTSFLVISIIISGFWVASISKTNVSTSQLDVAYFFRNNGDKSSVVISADYTLESVIVSISRQPVSRGGYGASKLKELNINKYVSFNFTKSDINRDNVGYLVLYSNNQVTPPYSTIIYQNKDYKIYKIKNK
jgi:asparagine N-glycosylation enzyme membrane subunit Stt3